MNLLNLKDFAKHILKILTKSGEILPLQLNTFQEEFIEKIYQCKKFNKPVRLIVLKARQLGISTVATAYIYHECTTQFHKKALVIANDKDNTNNLFNMCKRYYALSPAEAKPLQKYSNDKTLSFENPDSNSEERGLMSSIHLETAGKLTAGRSGTVQYLHISEFAFWEHAGTVVSGLFQAVPYAPNTTIIIESTANGMEGGNGEQFFKLWQDAEAGRNDFIPVFFPWWKCDDYEMIPPSGFILTDQEREIQDKYFPTHPNALNKLAWRRYKIANEMGSDRLNPEDQFCQEYPACPEEAFIASGNTVFSKQKIIDLINQLKLNRSKNNVFTHQESEILLSNLTIFKEPDTEGVYSIGADIAEGLESGDYSTICVINKSYSVVATYKAHIDPDEFGADLDKIGRYYNNALVAPEVNNMGIATINKLKRLKYPNLYTRTVKEQRDESPTRKIGWRTQIDTKRLMIADMMEVFRDDILNIPCIETLQEMLRIVRNPDGSVNLNGRDRTVALMIAIQGLKQASTNRFEAIKPGKITKRPKTLEEKLAYYDKKRQNDTEFN